ncbi:putative furrowed [Operophtera brumata]|uniref:Putative furrowed n=1 Tax=Operophtera brumata TaxID=104452 RepID=A0A0L7L6G4_OPEBR|nr:putative furrowed [Operophtera brumata]
MHSDEGVTKTFTCARPLIGQHVFLQLVGVEGSLSLCEVEVFTTEEFSNDRCAPASAPADIELAAFSRNCYEFNVAKGGSFEEARKQCQNHGGDLIHGFQVVPPTCGSPDKLLNTTIEGKDYRVGASIDYRCPQGHMLAGTKSRACLKDGFWSGVAPSCKYVDCGGISPIQDGEVSLVDGRTTHGARALYSCKENYTLVGEAARECGDQGTWGGEAPKCLFDWCPEPPPVTGGMVSVSGRTAGSLATYTCQNGFILFGSPSVTCTLGGSWAGTPPSCKYVDCGTPAIVHKGSFRLLNGTTTYGSVVQFTCEPDYWLAGSEELTCNRDGKWSHDMPSCELITCADPEVPAGGYMEAFDYNVHSTIDFHCERGHKLVGEASLMCEIRCPDPVVPENSIVSVTGNDRMHGRTLIRTSGTTHSGSTYRIGALVKYRCERGYKVVGESLSTCEDNGQWGGMTPKCQCVHLAASMHDMAIPDGLFSHLNYGSPRLRAYTLYCNFSFRIIPDVDCEITCPDPSIQIKGSVGLLVATSTLSIGGEAHYRCERGYSIKGNQTRTCLKKGQWNGAPPVCIPIDCKSPGTIDNGRIIIANSSTHFGSSIEYHCLPQFTRVGPFLRKCADDGHWSGEEPSCELATNEAAESGTLPLSVGVGCGVVLFLLMLLGVIYLRL